MSNVVMDVITILLHGIISLPDAMSCDKALYNSFLYKNNCVIFSHENFYCGKLI